VQESSEIVHMDPMSGQASSVNEHMDQTTWAVESSAVRHSGLAAADPSAPSGAERENLMVQGSLAAERTGQTSAAPDADSSASEHRQHRKMASSDTPRVHSSSAAAGMAPIQVEPFHSAHTLLHHLDLPDD
jgi:hypothetical protein